MQNADKVEKLLNDIADDGAREKLKILCLGSFEIYIKVMFLLINGSTLMFKPFHKDVIRTLEKYAKGKNEKRNLGISIPVGAGKSLIVEYFISWAFARSVNNTFLYCSHSDSLISRLSKETKDICTCQAWVDLFGYELKKDERSKVNWSFDGAVNRTGLMACTVGSGVTGLDAGNPNIDGFSGALIIDDPIDAGKIRSALMREEVRLFYTDKLATRRRATNTPTILIMQRLHKEDLVGYLKENEADDWEFLTIPAIENGESFWVERYPIEHLEKIKNVNPYLFSSQYQQNPISAGGEVINCEWFNYYDDISRIEPKKLFVTADTAMKVKEHNDYSVFCAWMHGSDNNLYLLDMLRGKWEAPELKKNAISFWNKWKHFNHKNANCFYIEDKASGIGLIQELLRGSPIPIVGIPRDKDKLTRLEMILGYIEAGRVYFPFNKQHAISAQIIAECESFTRDDSHSNDDIVDCLIDAVNKAFGIGSVNFADVL
jgi:predicted phage terminase large subunit-like protein